MESNYVVPKKFLKKGEGLKRFAAYKPPLPVSANPVKRRQTFVKFTIDEKPLKRDHGPNYLPPEILYNDSINLYTEIPKIAPPKIIHTPIRPKRQASNFEVKIDEPETAAPKRYNLRGSRKQNSESISADTKCIKTRTEPKAEPKRTRRQLKAIVERHISPPHKTDEEEVCITDSQINGDIDELMKKIEERKKSSTMCDLETEIIDVVESDGKVNERKGCEALRDSFKSTGVNNRMKYSQGFDLSSPSPGSCILALGQKIQHIESTVNILKDNIRNCECGAYLSDSKESLINKPTRKTTRIRANEKTRPSAHADNTTQKILTSLMNDVAQLKAKFDEIELRR